MREYANNNTEVYWDLDNVEFYMVDNSQPYTINSINYSTNSTYPTANAVAQSVNITKTKERLANASLVAELYDANGELKATSTQPISNTDFETNVATDIALTTQITLPDDFAWDWKIVTYIWDSENEDVLSEMYESKYNIDLQNLVSRQIFQRNANDIGKVKLQGVINADDVVTVEASAEKTEGTQKGSDVDWTPIAYDALTNTFNATLDVPAGGWYTIKVRAKLAGGGIVEDATEKIGVGEVFIMSGQSNSTNHGGESNDASIGFPLTKAKYDTISMLDVIDGEWALAKDPLYNPYTVTNAANDPVARKNANNGTTPWPTFANELAEKLDVPVGIVSVGIAATAIGAWANENHPAYQYVVSALQYFGVDGVRAILFHQGEANILQKTSKESYKSTMESAIQKIRTAAGWDVPWVIANVGFYPQSDGTPMEESLLYGPGIREAQQEICAQDPDCYLGPDTDTLVGTIEGTDKFYRKNNGTDVHLSYDGVQIHGQMWTDSVMNYFFDEQ